METYNVISTPEITGNIGSCTTQVIERVSSRESFWNETIESIATNSCTGEVSSTYHWGITDNGGLVIFFSVSVVVLLVVAFVVAVGESLGTKSKY